MSGCDDRPYPGEPYNYKAQQEAGFAAQIGTNTCAPTSPEQVIDHIFTYHSPNPHTSVRFQAIREAGKYFAKVIAQNVPIGQDRLNAILKVREAVMLANAGVSLEGFQL